MTVAYMADSTETNDIVLSCDLPKTDQHVTVEYVAGYVNGEWKSATTNQAKFGSNKNVRLVTIDVSGNAPSADVLDVENGDASPETAAWWIKHRIAAGFNKEYPGVIYCDRANLTPVFNAMASMGYEVGRDFRTWIATLDGTTEVADMTGVTAVQAYPAAGEPGPATSGHFDLSVVYDTAWKAPVAPPAPPVEAKTIVSVQVTYSDGSVQKI